jgi:hypothetical protein
MSGPTVDARAWSLLGPKVATATAIANSKLLLAAVKLCVATMENRKLSCQLIHNVTKKMSTEYTISGADTRKTDTIW